MTSSLKINSILHPDGGEVEYKGLPPGNIVNVTTIRWSRPISLSTFNAGAGYTYFGDTFIKKYDHTSLAVEATVFGQGPYSGNCAVGLVLDYGRGDNQVWDFGGGYSYDNAWQPYQIMCCINHAYFTTHTRNGKQIKAGSHSMHWGMYIQRSDQGTNRPFNNLSPDNNTTTDARVWQTHSTIVIREIGI